MTMEIDDSLPEPNPVEREGRMRPLFCKACGKITDHRHMHDTAHGIPETHMQGTERFICDVCGFVTFSGDDSNFPFMLDRKVA
jgi:hypothetical protein